MERKDSVLGYAAEQLVGPFIYVFINPTSSSFLCMSSLYIILNRSKVNSPGKALGNTDNLANVTVITVTMSPDTLVEGGSNLSICNPRE